MKRFLITASIFLSLLTACTSTGVDSGKSSKANSAVKISQDTAREMMAKDDGHIIVDVRRQDEYDAGHIPGAVLIPNETIGTEKPDLLPDPDQIILVYCRSGARSSQAAGKLAALGYTHVYDFGGIMTWTGEIVTAADEAEEPENTPAAFETEPMPMLCIEANGKIFYASLNDNTSAGALVEKLSSGPIEIEMQDYGNFEKVGPLPWNLPRNDEEITTGPGDVILYLGNRITVYYDVNSWNFTRLAKIEDVTRDELLSAFGKGNVTIRFWIEWSE